MNILIYNLSFEIRNIINNLIFTFPQKHIDGNISFKAFQFGGSFLEDSTSDLINKKSLE